MLEYVENELKIWQKFLKRKIFFAIWDSLWVSLGNTN